MAASWPPEQWRDVSVMVAVSGGPDSVALLRGLVALKRAATGSGTLYAAHFNHGLRGAESDDDAQFVRQLCSDLGVSCEVGETDAGGFARQPGVASEAASRDARYEFLRVTAERIGARYVVLAHTADDQAETILHRILRGTGLTGLAGMGRARSLGPAVTLIRPMLELRRADVLAYLEELGQSARNDSSNRQLRFTRNRLRHELLPTLAKEFNPAIVEALLRLGALAAESQHAIGDRVSELLERCVKASSDQLSIDCRPLVAERPYVVGELMIAVWRGQGWPEQSMGLEEWRELAAMVQVKDKNMENKRVFPGAIVAERIEDRLLLRRQL